MNRIILRRSRQYLVKYASYGCSISRCFAMSSNTCVNSRQRQGRQWGSLSRVLISDNYVPVCGPYRSMSASAPGSKPAVTVLRRLDYTPPPFLVDTVDLKVELDDEWTTVSSTLAARPNAAFETATGAPASTIELDLSKFVEVLSVAVSGTRLEPGAFEHKKDEDKLSVSAAATAAAVGSVGSSGSDTFEITTLTRHKPADNTELSGLYKAQGGKMFITQMEAQGFRRFSPQFDRPDVMSSYSCVVTADRTKYPFLLSNGNDVEKGEGTPEDPSAEGKHWVKWVDPWRKPTYLFALVAGDFNVLEDSFKRKDGVDVRLRIFAIGDDIERCGHAMRSLQRSMAWDERRFGRVYDLDYFNIVATPDFTMGAMENKSLNVFNTKYVLGSERSATDFDLDMICDVVGHEYFHNYSGNRVTCQDWFQRERALDDFHGYCLVTSMGTVTLKEGFTVFRDQAFTMDELSPAMKRLDDVRTVKSAQFDEAGGPMSHPIRPDEVEAIDNFYSVTVYDGGAEVVRMYETILGRDRFRRATDLYFERHDGQAVTCNDFCTAMEDANWGGLKDIDGSVKSVEDSMSRWVDAPFLAAGDRPLLQFRRWYAVAGTPHVNAKVAWDEASKTCSVTLSQTVPDTPTQKGPKPALHIPVRMSLLGPDGKAMPVTLRADPAEWSQRWGKAILAGVDAPGDDAAAATAAPSAEVVLHLTEPEQTFVLEGVSAQPVPSLLRNFSAPVRLTVEGDSLENRLFRLAHDTDVVNKSEAAGEVATDVIVAAVPAPEGAKEGASAPKLAEGTRAACVESMRTVLKGAKEAIEAAGPRGAVGGSDEAAASVTAFLASHILALPSLSALQQEAEKIYGCVDPVAIADAKKGLQQELGTTLSEELNAVWEASTLRLQSGDGKYDWNSQLDKACRAVRASALALLAKGEEAAAGKATSGAGSVSAADRALALQTDATNMTDEFAGFSICCALPAGSPQRTESIRAFGEKHKDDALVLDKWFRTQASTAEGPEVLDELQKHPAFAITNPNKVYALLGGFAYGNPRAFHDASGKGYAAVAEMLKRVDEKNAQVGARMAGCFDKARSVTPALRALQVEQVRGILGGSPSKNTREILTKTLKSVGEEAPAGGAAGGGATD